MDVLSWIGVGVSVLLSPVVAYAVAAGATLGVLRGKEMHKQMVRRRPDRHRPEQLFRCFRQGVPSNGPRS